MGMIIQAKCICGYQTEKMFVGRGMATSKTQSTFPVYCPTCQQMLQGNLLDEGIKCPNCHGIVIPYDDTTISNPSSGYAVIKWNIVDDNEVMLTSDNNLCPKCQNFNMGFFECGHWD